MTPSTAILAGSLAIAAAILGSAALLQPTSPSLTRAGIGPAAATAPASAGTPTDRYRIARVENGASWRLDRLTGEMTYCRVESDRMICAKSSQSTELPKVSAEELNAERDHAEEQAAKKNTAIFDRFSALFDRFLNFVERQTGKAAPPPDNPGQGSRAL